MLNLMSIVEWKRILNEVIKASKILEEDYVVYPYTKAIVQGILLPVPTTDVEEYTYEELKAIPSDRGIGMLGSSSK